MKFYVRFYLKILSYFAACLYERNYSFPYVCYIICTFNSQIYSVFLGFWQRCIELRLNMKICSSSKFSFSSLSTSTRLQFTSLSSKAGKNCFTQSEQTSRSSSQELPHPKFLFIFPCYCFFLLSIYFYTLNHNNIIVIYVIIIVIVGIVVNEQPASPQRGSNIYDKNEGDAFKC